jgi:hypothetical protein
MCRQRLNIESGQDKMASRRQLGHRALLQLQDNEHFCRGLSPSLAGFGESQGALSLKPHLAVSHAALCGGNAAKTGRCRQAVAAALGRGGPLRLA